MRPVQPRRVGAALLAGLLVLGACGGGDGGDDDGGTTAPGAVDGEGRQTKVLCEGEPRQGGVLVQLTPSYVDDLDVQQVSSFNVQDQAGPADSRLVAFRNAEDVEYGEQVIEGDLATERTISDDGLTYTFTLRDDVVRQDVPPVNGRPFVAGDVAASMNRVKAEGFASYMLENVESVEAPDDTTVVFRLSAPFSPLLNYLASHFMWILPAEATNGGFDPSTLAIGTGPFAEQLSVLDEEQRVELVHEIQRYIAEELQNPIPMWNYNTTVNLADRVCDYFPEPLYGFFEYRDIWLEE